MLAIGIQCVNCAFTATRAVLLDITVPENVGNVTISVLRLGDLSQRSRGTLTYRLLGPDEARGKLHYIITL